MKKSVKYERFCLKCKSTEVERYHPPLYIGEAFGIPPIYICKKCGFRGPIFPEIEVATKRKK